MSDSAFIISSDAPSAEAFDQFITGLDGSIRRPGARCGVFTRGNSNVWVALLDFDRCRDLYTESDIAQWQALLGAAPQVIVELQLGNGPEAQSLYLWIAHAFAQQWRSILYTVHDELLVDIPLSQTLAP